MESKILIFNIEEKFKNQERKIKKIVQNILAILNKQDCYVEIYLLGNRKMRFLNKKYRQKDKTTNVLSFEEPKDFKYPLKSAKEKIKNQGKRLGEIYLNLMMCQEYALKNKIKGARQMLETQFLILHGVLHLLGYDHIKKSDTIKMEAKEKEILAKLNFKK